MLGKECFIEIVAASFELFIKRNVVHVFPLCWITYQRGERVRVGLVVEILANHELHKFLCSFSASHHRNTVIRHAPDREKWHPCPPKEGGKKTVHGKAGVQSWTFHLEVCHQIARTPNVDTTERLH